MLTTRDYIIVHVVAARVVHESRVLGEKPLVTFRSPKLVDLRARVLSWPRFVTTDPGLYIAAPRHALGGAKEKSFAD